MTGGSAQLSTRHDSILVVVDMQERLLAAMPDPDREHIVRCNNILLRSAQTLGVPVLGTTQYARGLGAVHANLAPLLPEPIIDKTCFSCAGVPDFAARLTALRRQQVVLCGIEAHVCVLQTALDLLARGKSVFVIEDAVASRSPDHKHNALRRLAQAGVTISNTESLVFEWLRDAGHEHFKALSALIR